MYAHLIGKCRRKIVLDYFEEDSVVNSVPCCGVCECPPRYAEDRQEEVGVVLGAVQEIPGNGEIKVWISAQHTPTSCSIVHTQRETTIMILDFVITCI